MPILYQKMIYRDDLRINPTVFYCFGDNDKREGFGGQAREMRGEPNAVGIRTKVAPSYGPSAFWTDANLEENCLKIAEDLQPVRDALQRGAIVVIPSAGIGTDRAEMVTRCPRTFAYLVARLDELDKL